MGHIYAFAIAASLDKNTLHIFWSGSSSYTTENVVARYVKYDVTNELLGAIGKFISADVTENYAYNGFSAVCDISGYIYIAFTQVNTYGYVSVYKSIDNGASFQLDQTVLSSDSASLQQAQLYLTFDKYPGLVFDCNAGTYWSIKTTAWSAALKISTSYRAHASLSVSGADYIAVLDLTGKIYVYKRTSGATWTLFYTVTSANANYQLSLIKFPDSDSILLLYGSYTSSYLTYQIWDESSWSAAAQLPASLVITGIIPVWLCSGGPYFWVLATYWKLLKYYGVGGRYIDYLWIGLKTDAGNFESYYSSDWLSNSYQPADGRVPQTGKVNYIRSMVITNSPIEISSCDLAATK